MTRSHLCLVPISLLLILASVAGCSPAWNALNRGSLEADVGQVLQNALPEPRSFECRMIGTTRSGYCTLDLDRAGALAVAEDLGLESDVVDIHDPHSIPPAAAEGLVGCLSSAVLGPVGGLPAYWIGGRPDTLALPGRSQFEYLVLILNENTGQACVQVSYAYG